MEPEFELWLQSPSLEWRRHALGGGGGGGWGVGGKGVRRREASGLAERPTSEWIWLTRRGAREPSQGLRKTEADPTQTSGWTDWEREEC